MWPGLTCLPAGRGNMIASLRYGVCTQFSADCCCLFMLSTSRTRHALYSAGRCAPIYPTRHGVTPPGDQLPARVMDSIRIEPVRMLPFRSTSLPTATSPRNMSLRLPAMVISSTGYWIAPFSTQNPAAPRE